MSDAEEPRSEEMPEMDAEGTGSQEPEQQEEVGTAQQGTEEGQRLRLNFDDVDPEYANFCTVSARQGEVFLSFGKAFAPSEELKVDTQIVMSLQNVKQLYEAMGRLLQQQVEQQQGGS